jgi:predicted RNA methylase
VYEIRDYDAMFADGARTGAYLAAIERAVKPGSIVVEIGTGVGYFAVAACRAGARRVYAIDLNPAIELARRVAADNGCADRISFIHGDSRAIELPERGDVLLSDLRGVLPTFCEHIPTLVDARRRLLRSDATLIPRGDSMWAVPCAAPARWREMHGQPDGLLHGIDRRAVLDRVRLEWVRCWLDAADQLAEPAPWAALDYATIESSAVDGTVNFTIARDGALDGVAIWFDADFGSGISLSNAPSAPRALYGQAFFPFPHQLVARDGDRVELELRAHLVHGDYLWEWNTTVTPANTNAPIVFRQSNLAARIVALNQLRPPAPARGEEDFRSSSIRSTD